MKNKIFILIGFLVILELLGNVYLKFMPQWLQDRTVIAQHALERTGTHFIYNDPLGVVLRPNMTRLIKYHPDFKFTYQTSQLYYENIGIRGECYIDPKIVLLGDSFIEGLGVDEDKTIGHYLKALNLGQSGFTTNQELEIYKIALKTIAIPDKTILFIFKNDFGERLYQHFKYADDQWNNKNRVSAWLMAHSFLYKLMRFPDIYIREKLKQPGNDWEYVKDGIRLIEMDLVNLGSLSRKLIVVYVPTKQEAQTHVQDDQFFNPIKEVCFRYKIKFIDLTPYLSREDYFKNDGHWSERGNKDVAKILKKLI